MLISAKMSYEQEVKQEFAEQFAVFTINTVGRDHWARRDLQHRQSTP